MNNQTLAPRQNIEDVELAAALAAVSAFVAQEEETSAAPAAAVSRWRAAALLEGVGAARRGLRKAGAWSSWKAALALPLVWALSSNLCAYAAVPTAQSVDLQGQTLVAGGNYDFDRDLTNTVNIAPDRFSGSEENTVALSRPIANTYDDDDDEPTIGSRTKIRIGLALGQKTISIDAPDGASVAQASTGAPIAVLPPQTRWSLTPTPSGTIAFRPRTAQDPVRLATDNSSPQPAAFTPDVLPPLNASKVRIPSDLVVAAGQLGGYLVVPNGNDPDEQVLTLNGKLYRGALLIRGVPTASGTVLNVINVLDLEDYLLSVLPSEMPCTWPAGALQAQAIAARSYAIANLGKHAKEGYDLRATVDDQVYLGISSERQSTNDAIAATAGLILKHGGKPISAFFHSTSGGSTELSENVWGRPLPYLKSVVDYDDNSPHFAWTRKVQNDDIEKIYGKDIGQLLSMFVVARTPATSRARMILLVGTQSAKLVTGDSLRLALKLPSSNFNIGCEENSYNFSGRGFGHGLGMSQYGAKALAEQGYNAAQILTYYYKDVSVEYAAGAPGI